MSAYTVLCDLYRAAATLFSISSLLGWDQETYMPHGAGPFRAEQLAAIAELVHARRTDRRIGDLLAECERDASLMGGESGACVREMRRDYDRATKLPADLVSEIARTASQAQEAWKVAREKSDFDAFAPWLEKNFSLARRKAECYGIPAGGAAYDPLLDEYEPGSTAAAVAAVFTPLRSRLAELIARVAASKTRVKTKCLDAKIEPAKQHEFGLMVARAMGFDFDSGRLDTTAHPFCSDMGPRDVRLTTRYRDSSFADALYSTMHEAGHGIYEQGLPKGPRNGSVQAFDPRFGTPLAEAISLGIHESQSRMWENFVGRSMAFWKWALPRSKKHFGAALSRYKPADFYAAVNTVTPSFIRVEADEATYNLHVMIRFEIERALLAGDMKVREVPGEWNRRYKEYLGVNVPDARRGCLQDVHWSGGLIGYFPTYTLGNLYAAQFWETIRAQIPDLDKQMAKGQFGELKGWVNRNIHAHGRRYRAAELCERVTGKPLSADPLLRHLSNKASAVYGI